MRPILICFLIVAAIFGTVAVNPGSSWVLKNQLDMLSPSKVRNGSRNIGMPSEAVPDWLFSPSTYSGNSSDQVLARAFCLFGSERENELWSNLKQNPNDALGCAMYIRAACETVWGTPDSPRRVNRDTEDRKRRINRGIEACAIGERLEPSNVYFPLMRAMLSMFSDDIVQMQAALTSCRTKSQYSSHIREQALAFDHAALQAKGYRGEIVRMAVQSRTSLMDVSDINFLGMYINRHGSLAEKRDLVYSLSLLTKNEDAAIGILVARQAIMEACMEKVVNANGGGVGHISAVAWPDIADGFDRRIAAAKLPAIPHGTRALLQDLDQFTVAMQQYFNKNTALFEQIGQQGNWKTATGIGLAAPITAIICLMIWVPFAAIALRSAKSKFEWLRLITPHAGFALAASLVFVASESCCGEAEYAVPIVVGASLWMAGVLNLPKRVATYLIPLLAILCALPLLKTPEVELKLTILALAMAASLAANKFAKDDDRPGFAKWGSWAVLILGALSRNDLVLWGVFAFVMVTLLTGQLKEGTASRIVSALTVMISLWMICLGGVLCCEMIVVEGSPGTAVLIGTLAATLVGLLFSGKSFAIARNAACVGLVGFGVVYLMGVGLQLFENQRFINANVTLPNEANSIRAYQHHKIL